MSVHPSSSRGNRLPAGLALAAVVLVAGPSASADWKTTSGWNDLADFLGGTGLPDGGGVAAGQVEALDSNSRYLPHPAGGGTGFEFAGKAFDDVTGDGASTSGHASVVGRNFYGNVSSVCPQLSDVQVWEAGDFLDTILKNGGRIASSFTPRVANHSWIIPAAGLNNSTNDCRRLDQLINEVSVVTLVGANNGFSTTLPEAFQPCYNVISVGRSDGKHSAGFTPANRDGPGRIKPEIVVEQTATSWSTGAASSMTAALYSVAPAAAQRPEVMKAIVMAGATKEEFPAWDKTAGRPLDGVFGAGEMNILHSYRILAGGGQSPGPVPRRGWDLLAIGGGRAEIYTFTIPAGPSPAVFSLIATWNRTLTYSGGPRFGSYNPETLPNVELEFRDDSGALLQESRSAVDNVEHIYFQELSPGTYDLTVTTDLAVDVALAWRTEVQFPPRLVAPSDPGDPIALEGLITDAEYAIERSTDLGAWSVRDIIIATGSSMNWTDPSPPAGGEAFYRLSYAAP